jgi:hypothetical protein
MVGGSILAVFVGWKLAERTNNETIDAIREQNKILTEQNKTLQEHNNTLKKQLTPSLIIYTELEKSYHNFLDIVIHNVGIQPAYDITFTIKGDYECKGRIDLSTTGVFSKGIKFISPSQKIRVYFAHLADNFKEQLEKTFSIEVEYRDKDDTISNETFIIDYSHLENMKSDKDAVERIADSIKRIESKIST